MARRKASFTRILWRSFLASLSLGLALVVAEWAVRSSDPYGISYFRDTTRYINEAIALLPADEIVPTSRIFQNRPHAQLELESFDLATDALGLRCAASGELDPQSNSGAASLRILFLGDSVTLAWGVDYADCWTHQLELHSSASDGGRVECMNAGHLQYNTAQEADLFDSIGEALQPDAVVVTFVTNDVTDNPFDAFTRLMDQIALAELETGVGASLARTRSRVTGWFWGLRGVLEYRRLIALEAEPGAPPPAVEDAPGYAAGWKRSRAGFERLLAKTRELSIPLIVLDHGKPRIPAVQAWCEERGVPWYDFTFTDSEWAQGLRNSQADAHANARGNQLLFKKCRRALIAEGLLRNPDSRSTVGSDE